MKISNVEVLTSLTLFHLIFFLTLIAVGVFNPLYPFEYWGDALWNLVQIKSLIENNNPYYIPLLSAPFELSAASFPLMTNLDWFVMKIISIVARDQVLTVNIFWFFSIIFTSLTGAIALQIIGVKRNWLIFILALLYSYLPYTFLRNVVHLNLVFYSVPIMISVAILIAEGKTDVFDSRTQMLTEIFAVIQSLSYIYFSFFSIIFISFSSIIGYAREKNKNIIKFGIRYIVILILGSFVNIMPTLWSWHNYGTPQGIYYKSAYEAEKYALKLRQMLVPNFDNHIPIFFQWAKADAAAEFENENENRSARLGTAAACGFVLAILIIFYKLTAKSSNIPARIITIASITLFSFLVSTVGGLGAIFNLMISDFRAYNRMSTFIAFLSLACLGLFVEYILTRIQYVYKKYVILLIMCLSLISFYDQILDFKVFVQRQHDQSEVKMRVDEFVHKLENRLPLNAAVFQLPITDFPPDAGKVNMLPYDHAKAYLSSSRLRWSWPHFSDESRLFARELRMLNGKILIDKLRSSNFEAVWIDRYGYKDNGVQVMQDLVENGAIEILNGESLRYSVFSINTREN